jgi:protein-S-isoprenylcysteine O-methyltransferase Ste14
MLDLSRRRTLCLRLGGVLKQKHFIDSHKAATGLAVITMMCWYERWESPTLWLYFGLHGGYGLLWILKSRMFGDRQWDQKCSIWHGLYIWSGLSLYWVTPWLIASNAVEVPPWWLGVASFVFGVGVFYHFASDMQKHTTLSMRPGLFSDGLWSNSRNPNYFGELLIYASFSSLAQHWIPIVVMTIFISIVWIPNMLKKDKSLSRYENFDAYRSKSGLMFPKLF